MKEIKKNSERVFRAKRGFTLIELLVVIAIIGILVGLLLPAIAAARRYASIVKARNDVKQIETAWRAYYTEYQQWPPATLALVQPGGIELQGLRISGAVADLLSKGACDAATTADNPKNFTFITFKKVRQNGTSLDPINPWADVGTIAATDYYYVKVDQNYDNVIPVGTTGASGEDESRAPEQAIRSPIIVWTVNPLESDPQKRIIGSWK
jgi:prepilin-type N-terminal cleavage/methylation domain-containing protein